MMFESVVFGNIVASDPSFVVVLGLFVTGAITGFVSMLCYRQSSPQAELTRLGQEVASLRSDLHAFDGPELSVLWQLVCDVLRLSARQLRLLLLPTAIGFIPVGCVVYLLSSFDWFAQESTTAMWFSVAFWMSLAITALVTKWYLRIK